MRVLVVYESMYGNTRDIATDIAAGLRDSHEVTLVSVANATRELFLKADLLVAGAPTHMHGLSTASSRQAARLAAAKPDSGLTLDADAGGPAMRDWLTGLVGGPALAAAFDTRMAGAPRRTPWPTVSPREPANGARRSRPWPTRPAAPPSQLGVSARWPAQMRF